MTEIRFYHLERQSLDQVLPALLAKALEGGRCVVVKFSSISEMERIDKHLWTYHPGAFLPHGTEKDGDEDRQPVYLTTGEENPNRADILILTEGADSDNRRDYTLVCEILDGGDKEAINAARVRWKKYKDEGFEVTYWQQAEKGWEKKGGG